MLGMLLVPQGDTKVRKNAQKLREELKRQGRKVLFFNVCWFPLSLWLEG